MVNFYWKSKEYNLQGAFLNKGMKHWFLLKNILFLSFQYLHLTVTDCLQLFCGGEFFGILDPIILQLCVHCPLSTVHLPLSTVQFWAKTGYNRINQLLKGCGARVSRSEEITSRVKYLSKPLNTDTLQWVNYLCYLNSICWLTLFKHFILVLNMKNI